MRVPLWKPVYDCDGFCVRVLRTRLLAAAAAPCVDRLTVDTYVD